MCYLDYLYLLKDLNNKEILESCMMELNDRNIYIFTLEFLAKQLEPLKEIEELDTYNKIVEDIKKKKERNSR